MPSQTEIRQQVTQQIITALEQNLLPWRRPWRATRATASQPGRHSNVASRRAYQGVNPLLLELHAMQHGLCSKWWGTFPMWKSLGCDIKKRPPNVEEGCWGCRIVFWKPLTRTVVTDDLTGEEEDERHFVLRTFTVFNADQVEGAEAFQVHEDEGQAHAEPDFQPAEELIAASGADIRYGGDRAYYSRGGDFIVLPPRATFSTAGGVLRDGDPRAGALCRVPDYAASDACSRKRYLELANAVGIIFPRSSWFGGAADLSLLLCTQTKEDCMTARKPTNTRQKSATHDGPLGTYRPDDALLAFLESP